eukprot:1158643-Pelagomonas_calceolata.AAC.4
MINETSREQDPLECYQKRKAQPVELKNGTSGVLCYLGQHLTHRIAAEHTSSRYVIRKCHGSRFPEPLKGNADQATTMMNGYKITGKKIIMNEMPAFSNDQMQ